MTIQSFSILKTVALAVLVLTPAAAAAQNPRSTPAPTPAPRSTPATTTTAAPRPARTTTPATTARPWTEQEYRLGAGDKLRVEVYGESQLSQSLQVRPDGKITLPLVGDTTASGRTTIELRDAVTTSLKEYINNPVVTVIVVEATAAQIYIIGEVAAPGSQVMQGSMTILQALAQAGGLKEFADRGDIRILRKGNLGTLTIPFNYKDAIRGRIEPVYLQPGDTVVVP
jgi:polysaccharide biosynthesis/export protein